MVSINSALYVPLIRKSLKWRTPELVDDSSDPILDDLPAILPEFQPVLGVRVSRKTLPAPSGLLRNGRACSWRGAGLDRPDMGPTPPVIRPLRSTDAHHLPPLRAPAASPLLQPALSLPNHFFLSQPCVVHPDPRDPALPLPIQRNPANDLAH